MEFTHVFNAWTDESPGPMYFAVPFNAKDRVMHRWVMVFADSLPKFWHWNMTSIRTFEDIQNAGKCFEEIRKANGLEL